MKKFTTYELNCVRSYLMTLLNENKNKNMLHSMLIYDEETLNKVKHLEESEYTINDIFYIILEHMNKTEPFSTEFETKAEAHDCLTFIIESCFSKEFYIEHKDDLLYINKEFNKKTAYEYVMQCQAIEGEVKLNEQQLKEYLDSYVD